MYDRKRAERDEMKGKSVNVQSQFIRHLHIRRETNFVFLHFVCECRVIKFSFFGMFRAYRTHKHHKKATLLHTFSEKAASLPFRIITTQNTHKNMIMRKVEEKISRFETKERKKRTTK